MAWPKGKPRPQNAGRKKGTPNKITTEIRERARQFLEHPEAVETMQRQLIEGTLPAPIVTMLHHYAYGVPRQVHGVEIEADVKWTDAIPDELLLRQIAKLSGEGDQ